MAAAALASWRIGGRLARLWMRIATAVLLYLAWFCGGVLGAAALAS